MAAALLRKLVAASSGTAVQVTSAGTHSIPGLPMSTRTRTALQGVGASDPTHLSAQVDQSMVDDADLIAIFEPMHLKYMRKQHPDSAGRVASLPRLVRDLASGATTTVAQRVADLALGEHTFEPWEEVIDPAGGDLPEFEAAAGRIDELVRQLAPVLGLSEHEVGRDASGAA